MMNNGIDKLIIILGLDCFKPVIWPISLEDEVAEIKEIARCEFKNILQGADNYFMNADFSELRLKKLKMISLRRLESIE